jgi:hypothetical protein
MSSESHPVPALATSAPWTAIGISRASWNALRAQGKTPPPVYLLRGKPTWRISDLQKWLDKMRAAEKPSTRGGRRERADAAE